MMRTMIATVLAATLVTGCATWQEQNRTTKGAVYGTGAGAATGAAIGAILGGGEGAWKGAAIGAAVGGVGGGLIGNYMDRQAREMQEVLARQDVLERRGEEIYLSLSSDILFTSGSARLQPGAEDKLREVAGVLQRSGLATLLIDLLVADEDVDDERPSHPKWDIELLSDRLAQAERWTRTDPVLGRLPVGYFGASTGAAAALVAAARHPGRIVAVVSRGGRPDLADGELRRVTAPTLLISVQDDLYGTWENARYTAEHVPGAKFVSYASGGHIMIGHDEEAWREVRAFLSAPSAPASSTTSPGR